jgi:hypothetical protein
MTTHLQKQKTFMFLFIQLLLQENRASIKTKMLQVLFIWTALSFCIKGNATGDDGIEDDPKVGIISGSSLVMNATNLQFFVEEDEDTKKILNVIRLRVKEEYNSIIPADFTATAKVRIDYSHSSALENSITQTLEVTYKKGEGVKYNAKSYFSFEGAEFVRITLLEDITLAPAGSINIGDILSLENEMRVTRYYQLNKDILPSSLSTSTPTDELEVFWTWPANTGHTHTQLEWTWLEVGKESPYYNASGILDLNLLFKNNATRIDLRRGVLSYKIPLLYGGAGILYWRIRAVNIKKDGTRSETSWSTPQEKSCLGHNNDLNWQSTVTYAEDGNRKAVIQYYDGTLRSRQTVTKDNVTNAVITAETLYDGQGRPAIQVLPAPGSSAINTIAYTRGLNLFASNTDLNLPNQTENVNPAAFFDLQPITGNTSMTPALLPTSGSAAQYYSNTNPDINDGFNKNIPDAQGYPYTVTRYTPDASGRIMAQSGVGVDLKMGSKHETKYYYGTPAQEELNGLFGTEVGNYTHYFKNMVKDANGQMSVTYVDMHGRTIATALAGESPNNLSMLDLAQYPNQEKKLLTRNLLHENTNVIKNNSIESVNTLLVPYCTPYKFEYKLQPDRLSLTTNQNTTLCYDCMYNLEISITDESGEVPPFVYKLDNINLNADDDCNTAVVQSFKPVPGVTVIDNTITINRTLEPGSYIIRKTLSISDASLQKYREQYLAKGLNETEAQLAENLFNTLRNITKCDVPATEETCTTCNTTSPELTTKRALMIADMMPYAGQYSKETGSGTMYDKYNINPATNPASQDPDLAETLLPQHPEYQRLLFAESLAPSYIWMQTFRNTPDYTTASAKGYLFNSSSNITDPFYSIATDKKAAMANKLTGSYIGSNSMWQLAYGNAVCKTMINPNERNACYATVLSIPSSIDALVEKQKNDVWLMFRNLYAMERAKDLSAYIIQQRPLAEAKDLVTQGYMLHFPETPQQMAQQFGNTQGADNNWAWYPDQESEGPIMSAIPGGADPAQVYQGRCSDYIEQWKQSLLQCDVLNNHANKDQILSEITSSMVTICQKGSNEANPFGSSTVAPSTPIDGTYRSFEEAILAIFQKYSIPITDVCNPYVIEYPKPYGTGRRLTKEYIAVVESCHCEQFSKLKAEAESAGKDPNNLTELNGYLNEKYKDTLSLELFTAMTQNCSKLGQTVCKNEYTRRGYNVGEEPPCGCVRSKAVLSTDDPSKYYYDCLERVCETTGKYFVLQDAQPMPLFLKCGFEGRNQCIDCARLSELTGLYKTRFPNYDAPVITSGDLNEAQIRNNVLFHRFLNYHTGFQYTWVDYLKAANAAGCDLNTYASNSGAHQNVICGDTKPLNDPADILHTEEPCQNTRNMADAWAHEIFQVRRQKLWEEFEKAYREKCLAVQQSEHFTVDYDLKEYHYTLYYYDMAGNLVKTVPPKGVRPNFSKTFTDQVNTARVSGSYLVPSHVLTTNYRYNSLNQVVAQNSPDGGTSAFWYDRLGRLVVSQNAQQKIDNKYSYTLYDDLGRIVEVGQKPHTEAMNQTTSQNKDVLNNWINVNGGVKEQITVTGYDIPYGSPFYLNGMFYNTILEQHNLRNRVSYTAVKKLGTDSEIEYYTATFYNYDIHGNVDRLVQDYKGIAEMKGNDDPNNEDISKKGQFKKIYYDYDLISGEEG